MKKIIRIIIKWLLIPIALPTGIIALHFFWLMETNAPYRWIWEIILGDYLEIIPEWKTENT